MGQRTVVEWFRSSVQDSNQIIVSVAMLTPFNRWWLPSQDFVCVDFLSFLEDDATCNFAGSSVSPRPQP